MAFIGEFEIWLVQDQIARPALFELCWQVGLRVAKRADPCRQPLNNLHLRQVVLRPDIVCASSERGCGAAFSSEERGSVQQEAPAPRCFTADARRGFVSGIFEVARGSCESCASRRNDRTQECDVGTQDRQVGDPRQHHRQCARSIAGWPLERPAFAESLTGDGF